MARATHARNIEVTIHAGGAMILPRDTKSGWDLDRIVDMETRLMASSL